MGYGTTDHLIYGVYLDPTQSQALREGISRRLAADPNSSVSEYLGIPGGRDPARVSMFELVEFLGDEDEAGIRVAMVAEDTHSTIHDNTFEEGFCHGFGILLADKGYGAGGTSKEFKEAMARGASQEQIAAFQERILPWLQEAGLGGETPELVTVSCIS